MRLAKINYPIPLCRVEGLTRQSIKEIPKPEAHWFTERVKRKFKREIALNFQQSSSPNDKKKKNYKVFPLFLAHT